VFGDGGKGVGVSVPEPYVFGPPGSGSGSVSPRYGSCKNSKKILDSYCFVTSF
jgi:hypothetical protein